MTHHTEITIYSTDTQFLKDFAKRFNENALRTILDFHPIDYATAKSEDLVRHHFGSDPAKTSLAHALLKSETELHISVLAENHMVQTFMHLTKAFPQITNLKLAWNDEMECGLVVQDVKSEVFGDTLVDKYDYFNFDMPTNLKEATHITHTCPELAPLFSHL